MIYTCEMCDTEKKSTRREDNIYVCDECNIKYPMESNQFRKKKQI